MFLCQVRFVSIRDLYGNLIQHLRKLFQIQGSNTQHTEIFLKEDDSIQKPAGVSLHKVSANQYRRIMTQENNCPIHSFDLYRIEIPWKDLPLRMEVSALS